MRTIFALSLAAFALAVPVELPQGLGSDFGAFCVNQHALFARLINFKVDVPFEDLENIPTPLLWYGLSQLTLLIFWSRGTGGVSVVLLMRETTESVIQLN